MSTTSVEVRDDKGTLLGRVRVPDTKLQALERLGRLGAGGLFDREDVGLLEGPVILPTTVLHPTETIQRNSRDQNRDHFSFENKTKILPKSLYKKSRHVWNSPEIPKSLCRDFGKKTWAYILVARASQSRGWFLLDGVL